MIKFKMTRTALVTTATIITLGIYDLFCVASGGVEMSVSSFLANVGFKSPFFVFALGYVCGHLTGYMKPIIESEVKQKGTEYLEQKND